MFGKLTYHWYEWQRWFAWRPVRLNHGQYAWLEVVERRSFDRGNSYTYREKR